MNLVSATLEFDARADVFAARFGGQTVLRLPSLWNATLRTANVSQVVIGIPPTAFTDPGSSTSGEAEGWIEATVASVEALVGEVVVTLSLPTQTTFVARFPGMDDDMLNEGRLLRLHVDNEQVRLFDPETEAALIPAT